MAERRTGRRAGKTVLGIDVGGSTTKIVGFRPDGSIITPLFVKAADPLTSAYGAFGKFTVENGISLGEIGRVNMTGVGSAFITEPIFSLPLTRVAEFDSIGIGGLYLSGLDEAIVVSMGTGTAIIHAVKDGGGLRTEYLGGTGVGGGTINGLARKMLGIESVTHLAQVCEGGDLGNIDLRVSDISRPELYPGMKTDLTASNFGKHSDLATKADVALGIFNLVAETVAMMAVFASRRFECHDVVITGNLTVIEPIRRVFETLGPAFDTRFLIPENSRFGTVIGAALQ
jgi:type II pantothenate kinase